MQGAWIAELVVNWLVNTVNRVSMLLPDPHGAIRRRPIGANRVHPNSSSKSKGWAPQRQLMQKEQKAGGELNRPSA